MAGVLLTSTHNVWAWNGAVLLLHHWHLLYGHLPCILVAMCSFHRKLQGMGRSNYI